MLPAERRSLHAEYGHGLLMCAASGLAAGRFSQTMSPYMSSRHFAYAFIRTPLLPLNFPQQSGHKNFSSLLASFLQTGVWPENEAATYGAVISAISIASPDLALRLKRHLSKTAEPKSDAKDLERLTLALSRYAARASRRATPFGLFAAVNDSQILEKSGFSVSPSVTPVVFWKAERIESIVSEIKSIVDEAGQLRFVRNPQAYELLATLKAPSWDSMGRFVPNAIHHSELAAAVLNHFTTPSTAEVCRTAIATKYEGAYNGEQIATLIQSLARNQLIVTDIDPPLTIHDPLNWLGDKIRGTYPSCRSALDVLSREQVRLRSIQQTISQNILSAGPSDSVSEPDLKSIHVDTWRQENEFYLSSDVVRKMIRCASAAIEADHGANALHKKLALTVASHYGREPVSLIQMVDQISGVGTQFRTILSEQSRSASGQSADPGPEPTDYDEIVSERVHRAMRQGDGFVDIADMPRATASDEPAEVQGALFAEGAMTTRGVEGPLWLKHFLPGSGFEMLGRFANQSENLKDQYRRAVEAHAYKGADLFEVVFAPSHRQRDVGHRPQPPYPILHLSPLAVGVENQMGLSDIIVQSQNDSLVLRSASSGRVLVPRSTSAVRSDVEQGWIAAFFSALSPEKYRLRKYPTTLNALPYLPRLVWNEVVLQPRRWILASAQKRQLASLERRERVLKFKKICNDLNIPPAILVGSDDNLLPVDIEDDVSVLAAWPSLVSRRSLILEDLCDRQRGNSEATYVFESVVPVCLSTGVKTRNQVVEHHRPSERLSHILSDISPPASFGPGSEWLSLEVYCDHSARAEVLESIIAPIILSAETSSAMRIWYFVQYSEPSFHYRVRLRLKDPDSWSKTAKSVVDALSTPAARATVRECKIVSYNPEWWRYGGAEGMPVCEEIFAKDTQLALAYRAIIRHWQLDSDTAWRLGIGAASDCLLYYLGHTGLPAEGKHELLKNFLVARSASTREYQGFRRSQRDTIENLADRSRGTGHQLNLPHEVALNVALQQWHRAVSEVITTATTDTNKFSRPYSEIVPSLVHMLCNRLFCNWTPGDEMLVLLVTERALAKARFQERGAGVRYAELSEG